jgi:hypothetical protein
VDALLTRQAVRTLLHYLSETNGEMHLFLNEYLAAHPLVVDAQHSAREWLATLAAQPLTRVSDPGRASAPSAAALSAADPVKGVREVSPREVVERVLALRVDIASEMCADLEKTRDGNASVLRAALARTLATPAPPPAEE